jgi:MFS family permease
LGFSGVPGLVIVGLVSDFFIRRGWGRKIVLMITYFAGAFFMVLFALSLEGKFSLWFLVLTVFLIVFFLWGTYPIIYAVISEVAPHEVGGVAFGFSNTIMMIGAALSPWIGGLIRDLTGSFTLGVYMLSLLSAIAGLTVFLVKEEST